MKSMHLYGAAVALGLVCAAGAQSAEFNSASLLPSANAQAGAYANTGYVAAYQAAQPQQAEPVPEGQASASADCGQSGNAYLDKLNTPWSDDCTAGAGSVSGGLSYGRAAGCGGPWFAGAKGLWMTRDNENRQWFSYFDSDESLQLNKSTDAQMGWSGGFEVHIGRAINCDCNALDLVYWGVFPGDQEINLYSTDMPGSLNSTFDFSRLNYDNGVDPITSVDGWFDDAERHRLRRDFEMHNVELNLLGGQWRSGAGACGMGACGAGACGTGACGGCNFCPNPWRFSWLFGVRYFQFSEGLQFATSNSSPDFGVAPEDEMYYNIDVRNHLVGVQLGATADYGDWCGWSFHSGAKVGLYGSHISHMSQIVGASGTAAWVGAGPNANEFFDIHTSKNDVAFMAELNLGLDYQISQCWRATVGYRAVAVTGVALSTTQIPYNFAGIEDVEDVDSNGSLILHGGYAGLEFNW